MKRSTFFRNAVLLGGGSLLWIPSASAHGPHHHHHPWILSHVRPIPRPVPQPIGPVEVRSIAASVSIQDQIAKTNLVVTFFNPAGRQQEGQVLLPVPSGAVLKSFAMEGANTKFEAFFEPEDIFTNKFQEVGKGIVVQPSPLLSGLPDFVQLHFEIDGSTREVRSPQVPVGNERDLAESSGISAKYLDATAAKLAVLKVLLAKPGAMSRASGSTNLDQICAKFATVNDAYLKKDLAWNLPDQSSVERKEASVRQARGQNKVQVTRLKKYQEDVAIIEKSKRAEVYLDNAQRAIPKQVLPNAPGNVAAQGAAKGPQATEEQPVASLDQDAAGSLLVEINTRISPFQPIWLGDDLMAVREVRAGGTVRYQGVWLHAGQLSKYLLASAADLLPDAGLERIAEVSATTLPGAFKLSLDELSNDPLSLVTFPWRLQVGESALAASVGWTALRISLLVGWIALLLALIASAVLVRGVMKLSDRRATFVSSVTHELRTPLTTFHLYSDMLAEGMVQDEEKKKGYLTTMRREAERLNHLVENVLAYSRVERGSARAHHEKVSLESLVERMQPRLTERARKDRADLKVDADGEASEVQIDTDLTAVEQIVFNLVDNACKYGLPDQGERVIHLRASNGGKTARIEVCDEGGGIARADLKKLFRPFHKSARDAAHSKPGVGLGLALCRRLARALGGNLRIDGERSAGACFVLELPVTTKG